MGKKKQKRWAENATFPNFFQPLYHELLQGFPLRGRWHQDFFKNQNPIVLELGCGKGEYTVGLAQRHTEKNFIGIDVKGARMWRGCRTSVDNRLRNVAFIRTRIQEINAFFAPDEVSEIWITFPDPQPRKPKTTKRLTSPPFLERYSQLLKPEE